MATNLLIETLTVELWTTRARHMLKSGAARTIPGEQVCNHGAGWVEVELYSIYGGNWGELFNLHFDGISGDGWSAVAVANVRNLKVNGKSTALPTYKGLKYQVGFEPRSLANCS